MDKRKRDEKLKELSDAIVKAMTNDDEVMSLLDALKANKMIENGTLLGMAIKVSELLEIADIALAKGKNEPLDNGQVVRHMQEAVMQSINDRDIIDGHDLSENEVAFQEWAIERFDEKEWLKDCGLIW